MDYPGRGWYLVDLDIAVPVYSEPVSRILIQSIGAMEDDSFKDLPRLDPQGKRIVYYFERALEELLLNPKTTIRYVLVLVGVIRDETIVGQNKLSRSQIHVHPYAKAFKVKY